MNISIGDNHKDLIARQQHVLEWLQGERARLEAEHAHVAAQGDRLQRELITFLAQVYGIDPSKPVTVDAEGGMIIVPDITPAVESQPDTEADS